jgi:hypothetical protein
VRCRLVSVASRHMLRLPAARYATSVLLPRLQVEGLLEHVLAPATLGAGGVDAAVVSSSI